MTSEVGYRELADGRQVILAEGVVDVHVAAERGRHAPGQDRVGSDRGAGR